LQNDIVDHETSDIDHQWSVTATSNSGKHVTWILQVRGWAIRDSDEETDQAITLSPREPWGDEEDVGKCVTFCDSGWGNDKSLISPVWTSEQRKRNGINMARCSDKKS